jgi:hypothetical protein
MSKTHTCRLLRSIAALWYRPHIAFREKEKEKRETRAVDVQDPRRAFFLLSRTLRTVLAMAPFLGFYFAPEPREKMLWEIFFLERGKSPPFSFSENGWSQK